MEQHLPAPTVKRYAIELACGHEAASNYPPLGSGWPCAECPGTPHRTVVRFRDTLLGLVTQLRMAS